MVSAKRLLVGATLAAAILGGARVAEATTISEVTRVEHSVSDDLGDLSNAARSHDMVGLQTACIALQADAIVFRGLHRPKGVSRHVWALSRLGMDYYRRAGESCEAGARAYDAAALREGVTLLDLGTAEIKAANEAMH